MVIQNMCDTNKNVTKIDMIIKAVYYIQITIKRVYSFWMLNDMRLCVQTPPPPPTYATAIGNLLWLSCGSTIIKLPASKLVPW
jgi:hypothetical protein